MKKYFKETVIPAIVLGSIGTGIYFATNTSINTFGVVCMYLLFLIPMTIQDWWTRWRGDRTTTHPIIDTSISEVPVSTDVNEISADEARRISNKVLDDKSKDLRNSDKFKERKNWIISLIKEESAKGNYYIIFPSSPTPETKIDMEIKKDLEKKSFNWNYDENYSEVKLSW